MARRSSPGAGTGARPSSPRRANARARIERVLQESEARYRSLVTATAQIVWVTDTAGQVVTQLPAWQAFTGQSFEEYRARGWTAALHPEDHQRVEAAWLQAVATRSLYEIEYRLRRADGCYRHVIARGVPVMTPDNEIQEWVGTCTDITERKEADRRRDFTNALLGLFAHKPSSKEYLDAVVETTRNWTGCRAVGIRLVNEHQQIPYESCVGFDPEFLRIENCLSVERDKCCCIRAISQSMQTSDAPLLTPGGSFLCADSPGFLDQLSASDRGNYQGNCVRFGYASLAVVPIRFRNQILGALHLADPRPGFFTGAMVKHLESIAPLIGEAVRRFRAEAEVSRYRDQLQDLVSQRTAELERTNQQLQLEIAQRKEMEEALRETARELQRSNNDLEQFAYVASHDLQEPLRAVAGYVRLLERRFPSSVDDKAREYIAGAADGAARMETLIKDLLAFSRVGTHGAAFIPTDLNPVLQRALSNLQQSIKTANAKLTHDSLPILPVDAPQIVQLFQNLVSNALKFRSQRPPAIHVGAVQESQRWRFFVRDNGIGIEPQYFDRIFQIFQRLHTRTRYPGTGIGLAICKKIVERHHGEIWVESRLGEGSVFHFTVPVLQVKS